MMDGTKTVVVSVRLTVPENIDIDVLVREMGYQFTCVTDAWEELILDSEITNAVEYA